MLARVVRSLRLLPSIRRIVVSVDDPAVVNGVAELRALADAGVLGFHLSGRSPSLSALDYFASLPAGEPLLVTTADHPLLTAQMLDHFCSAVENSKADVVVGVVSASLFRAHYPESKRSFIRFRDESFCGANLFALCSPRATAAAAFWAHAGKFRKRPWRLVSTFGPVNLALLVLRRLDLEAALVRASRVMGARIEVVPMPFAECAIDVDSPADLATATRILAAREAAAASPDNR
jgi:2-phospho-L-lactate guanylyltransferase (CobY/MobA/RfbA family)